MLAIHSTFERRLPRDEKNVDYDCGISQNLSCDLQPFDDENFGGFFKSYLFYKF
jgi:hypothetical protein